MGKRKNLLYIFADQWRAHAVGAAGQDQVWTPNMDRFAKESMGFTNAVSTYPLCSPHRASLLTGKYPYCCGMWTNCKIGLDEVLMLKPQEVTITDVLHEEGYENAYIGKWHLDASELNFTEHPESGAVNWDAYTPDGERRHHMDYWVSYGAMDQHLAPHYWKDSPEKIRPGIWSPEYETDLALDFLKDRNADTPFCMFLSWNPPHPPYDLVPEKYVRMYEGELVFRDNVPEAWRQDPEYLKKFREYYGAVSGLDENFGRILEFLREHGLEEDTVVVLSADHGDCMGSHGLYGKNVWYEESVRIPLYIRGKGFKAGTSDVLIASQDHMPTLLELLEAPVPDTVQGTSYGWVLKDKEGQEAKDAFLCMIPGMPELVEKFRSLGLNHKAYGWRGLRGKHFTYVADRGTMPGGQMKRYYYDLETDPYQLAPRMLAADDELAVELDGRIRDYLKKTMDPFLLADG